MVSDDHCPLSLTRDLLLSLLIRCKIEPAALLDVTVVALHAERIVESVHELEDDRSRRVLRPDL
jgi:hypothetical protein